MEAQPRLAGKNILIIIPKDHYDEDQLDPLLEQLRAEGADVRVGSTKFKEAIGMRKGRHMPDVLLVDAVEGIAGDAYVTGGRGHRQIKGVYHAVIIIGGRGTKKHLWKEKLVRLLLTDRYKSNMVVGALGNAVPCLAEADLLRNVEVAAELDKTTQPELEKAAAILTDDAVCVYDRLVTARGAEAVDAFAEAIIPLIAQTKLK